MFFTLAGRTRLINAGFIDFAKDMTRRRSQVRQNTTQKFNEPRKSTGLVIGAHTCFSV